MMKKIVNLFVMAAAFSATAVGQNPARAILPQGPPALPIFIEDINGRPYSSAGIEDIEGSPFLQEEWNWGAVKFRDGRYAKDLSLRFNVYNNKLYFKKYEEQLEFVQPVQEFMLGYVREGDSVATIYRSGYPASASTNNNTFFELLVDGKFQLLNYHTKDIRSFKPYNQPEKKKFEDSKQLYAFTPNGKLVKLKKDRDALIEAMPDYADRIRELSDKNKLKLKNESGILELFRLLNQSETGTGK